MAVSQSLPRTELQEPYMIEVIGDDGLVHHLGPFKTRDEAESWIAANAPSQCNGDKAQTSTNDTPTRKRRAGSSSI